MSNHLDDAKNILARAKQVYHRALRQVDAKLRAAVSESPAYLDAANAIQDDYASGYVGESFSPNEQPGVPAQGDVITDPVEIEKALTDLEPEPVKPAPKTKVKK